jgi:hypothetical protein
VVNDVIQDQEQAAMTEILEDESRHNQAFVFDFGTELTAENMITEGSTGDEVEYFIVPFETKNILSNKTFTNTTVEMVFRVGFKQTLRPTKTIKKRGKGSAKIADIISGMSNMNVT